MSDRRARVVYLGHSGFLVETVGCVMIFDYYMDDPAPDLTGIAGGVIRRDELIALGKPVYVFVSHAHADHFNPVIYHWLGEGLAVTYVISSDVPEREGNKIMAPGDNLSDGLVKVQAYGSTDEGVSFLVEVDGFRVFHAGDLNWWHWRSQSTPEEINASELAFYQVISSLDRTPVDVAFFPVDPRMGEYYYAGASYYIEEIKPRVFFPMHFHEEYEITAHFARLGKSKRTKVTEISGRGQEFWIAATATVQQ